MINFSSWVWRRTWFEWFVSLRPYTKLTEDLVIDSPWFEQNKKINKTREMNGLVFCQISKALSENFTVMKKSRDDDRSDVEELEDA